MQKALGIILGVTLSMIMAATSACAENTNEVFSLHFAGLKDLDRPQMAAAKSGAKDAGGDLLRKMLNKTETANIKKIFYTRLADSKLFPFMGSRPMLTLLDCELYAAKEVGGAPSFVFASKLGRRDSEERYELVRKEIAANLGVEGKVSAISKDNGTNKGEIWSTVDEKNGKSIVVSHGSGWYLYYEWQGNGEAPKSLPTELVRGENVLPDLGTNRLTLNLNVDALSKENTNVCPVLANVSTISLNGYLHEENVRTSCRVKMKQAVNFVQNDWILPTNIIKDPIIQLSALRGASNLFAASPWWQKYGKAVQTPNVLFLSASAEVPFQTAVIVDSGEIKKSVSILSQSIDKWLAEAYPNNSHPTLAANSNAVEVGWFGWPILKPYLRGIKDGEQEYMMMGLLLGPIKGDPLSPELWKQITSNDKLFYYSWEITGARFKQDQAMNSLLKMLFKSPVDREEMIKKREERKNADPKELAKLQNEAKLKKLREKTLSDWMTKSIQDCLGNSITKGTQVSETELLFERQSSVGLTAQEFWWLCEWILDR